MPGQYEITDISSSGSGVKERVDSRNLLPSLELDDTTSSMFRLFPRVVDEEDDHQVTTEPVGKRTKKNERTAVPTTGEIIVNSLGQMVDRIKMDTIVDCMLPLLIVCYHY